LFLLQNAKTVSLLSKVRAKETAMAGKCRAEPHKSQIHATIQAFADQPVRNLTAFAIFNACLEGNTKKGRRNEFRRPWLLPV
jgi:hypothetical protein